MTKELPTTADVVVIGAGLSGLVAANALAAKGKKVVVVEKREILGGLSAAFEIAPGYTAPGIQDGGLFRHDLMTKLGLGEHGLETSPAPSVHLVMGEEAIVLDGDEARGLEKFSPADTKAFAAWRSFLADIRPFVRDVLSRPPPKFAPETKGDFLELGLMGLSLRRLGKDTMVELMRISPTSVADFLEEKFETKAFNALLALPAVEGAMVGPLSAGTTANLLLDEIARGPTANGGAAQIVHALVAKAKSNGVTLVCDVMAQEIQIKDRAVCGVHTSAGDIATSCVVSAVDVKHAVLDLLPTGDVPLSLVDEVKVIRTRATAAVVALAVEGGLPWRSGQTPAKFRAGPTSLLELESLFDAVKYTDTKESALQVAVSANVVTQAPGGASLAPAGSDVVMATVSYVSPTSENAEAARDAVLDRMLDVIEECAPHTRDRIVGHKVMLPADLEATYGLSGGQLHHGEHALDQLLFMRPSPALAHNHTPIGGLFVCGGGCHPQGGGVGTSGLLAAKEALRSR